MTPGELRELPHGAERWNRAHRGAFLKGQCARIAGEPITACPYPDTRKWNGKLTWSRVYVKCWMDGWRHQEGDTP